MDIPRLLKMNRYWHTNPPVREMIQAYLGIEITSDDDKPARQDSNVDELIAIFGGIGGKI